MINVSRIKQGMTGPGRQKWSLSQDGIRRSNVHLLPGTEMVPKSGWNKKIKCSSTTRIRRSSVHLLPWKERMMGKQDLKS